MDMREWMLPLDAARKWKCSRQRVEQWLADGRIPGAWQVTTSTGRVMRWMIPIDARRPTKRPSGRPPDDKSSQEEQGKEDAPRRKKS